MKYLVEYFNIQGFVGLHSFTLEEGINSISSKYNGTGKSTLFDCLRLLAARNNHDKEDLFYMVNHDALEGFFRMTTSCGEAYGFYMDKEKGSFLYTRLLPDDTAVAYSDHPFPEMWQKLNLFVKNGNYVNIADRFIDLFTSSNVSFNSGLVQELMLHEEAEKVYSELLSRMEFAKEDMTKKFSEANTLMVQRDALPFYPKLQNLANILHNEELIFNYETLVSAAEEVAGLQKEPFLINLDYNYTALFRVKELVRGLTTVPEVVDLSKVSALFFLYRLKQDVVQLFSVNKVISTSLILFFQNWGEIRKEVCSLEEEKKLVVITSGLLPLLRVRESLADLEEEKSLINMEKHTTVALILLNLQKLLKGISLDQQVETRHLRELAEVQEQLVGLTCPTCKQVIREGITLCEHLS